jgi:hypothetical protein
VYQVSSYISDLAPIAARLPITPCSLESLEPLIRVPEKLTALLELERAICIHLLTDI